MQRMLRLPARIALVVAAGALLVAVGVTLLLVNTVRLHQSADATRKSDAYLVAAINLERLVVDAETGLRGYVITGRRLFLAPTQQAQQRLAQTKAQLASAARADGSSPGEAQRLASAADTYMNDYVPRVLALAARDRRTARTYAVTLRGKQLVDGVRTHAAVLERLVSARERARQRTPPKPRPATPRWRRSSCSCCSRWPQCCSACSRAPRALARAGPAAQRPHRRGVAPEPSADGAAGHPGLPAGRPLPPGPGGRARRRGLLRRLRGQRRPLGDHRRRRLRQRSRGRGGHGDGAVDAAQPRLMGGGPRRGPALPQPRAAR